MKWTAQTIGPGVHMRLLITLIAALLATATTACSPAATAPSPSDDTSAPVVEQPAPPMTQDEQGQPEGIYAVELTDVVSGESFRLADLKGRPVLLHPFAMW